MTDLKKNLIPKEKFVNKLKQNIEDIKKFYKFLAHETKTVFQVYEAMVDKGITPLPSKPSEQIFILHNDIELLLKLCDKYKLTGQICLGINERPNEQTKLTDKLPKINVILFDIDVRKEKKVKGVSPVNLKKEAKSVMEKCKSGLEKIGFTTDLIVDSGNGYHVYIKIEINIPNYSSKEEFENTDIYKRLVYLENQLRKFNTKNVEIDFLSKDIIRRVKIPGTYNVKRYKDSNGKFRVMPKNQWRIAKILYLNQNINEQKNNEVFSNLPIEVIEIDDSFGIKPLKNTNEILNNILEQDEKLKNLYNGIISPDEYKSRSEAELSFIINLLYHKTFSEVDIYKIMNRCQIGKWEEKGDSYKKLTIKKAIDYVQKNPKRLISEKDKKKLFKNINIKEIDISPEELKKLKDKFIDVLQLLGLGKEELGDIKLLLILYQEIFSELIEKPIKYDNDIIIISKNGIFLLTGTITIKKILNRPLELVYKTVDINRNYTELFSFYFNNIFYRNYSIKDALKILEPNIQKYSKLGRDIIKMYFNHLSVNGKLEEKVPVYILGWKNNWLLPQNEEKKNMTIVTHTEYQEEIYTNVKERLISEYSETEIKNIKEKMKLFIDKTQTDNLKLSIIIGWCISAPFRLYFIEKFQLFVLLYFCGNRNTGKSSMGDFYITDFYNIFDEHINSSVLNSVSRTEDLLTTSTFPFNIQEVSEIKDPRVIDILKDTTTGNSKMIRKNPDQTLKIYKLEIAPVCLDGNKVLKRFMDEAWNSKMHFLKFNKDEEIHYDKEWIDLAQELKKIKLFTLIYNHTKDWTNKDIEKRVEAIQDKYYNIINELYGIDSRLAKTYITLLFGIELFEDVFDIELDKNIKDSLIESRSYISEDLTDMFINFCKECIELGNKENDSDKLKNLPYYLKHSLKYNKNNEAIFISLHLADFNKLNKSDYGLSELYDLLCEDPDCRSKITQKSAYSNLTSKSAQSIVIEKTLLESKEKITDYFK
ncbi:MAG: hypothetical protein ACFFG0_33050 [Candidatus Thorarchaeota archaeon]